MLSVLLGLSASPVSPQGLWTEASTIGYGATGFGLGLSACWSCSYESGAVVILAATVAGGVIGHRIGGSAEGAARRREQLTPGQLWGARVGTVTGFTVLGTALAALIINETEGNAEGEDERRLLTYSLVGAGVGILVEIAQEAGLSSNVSTALRNVLLEPGDGGAPARLAVRWRH